MGLKSSTLNLPENVMLSITFSTVCNVPAELGASALVTDEDDIGYDTMSEELN